MSRNGWTREQLLLAINLYCKIPFGRIHQNNPDIIELATLIGRSSGAIAWKMCNFAHIDPSLDRQGAAHVSHRDIETWNEFFNNWDKLIYESESILIKLKKEKESQEPKEKNNIIGKDIERMSKVRIHQDFFRQTVLSTYNLKCCITGMSIPELLISSHIIPWAKDKRNRLNPRNGLCLNALHDKAFDKGLITVSDNFKVIVSKLVRQKYNKKKENKLILDYDGVKISKPNRFIPDLDFIKYHNDNIFIA
jgi:putative restriction endonuclease